MDDEEYYRKIKRINKENLYKQIRKKKSDIWKNFEVTGTLNKKEKIHDTVTALAESDATGETAKIFSEIRSTMKIPMLTSIWRILADSFDDLDLSWKAVKPLYETGQPEAALNRLHKDASFPNLEPISLEEIEKIGISNEDLISIKSILKAYNRSNSLNLLTQSALVTDEIKKYVPYPTIKISHKPISIPRLLPREEISDLVWEEILKINKFGTNTPNPGIATIFRHLAYWPKLLSLMQIHLQIAQKNGEISIGANSVSKIAIEEGNRMMQLRDENAINKMSSYARSTIIQYVNGPFKCARIVNIGTALYNWLEKAK